MVRRVLLMVIAVGVLGLVWTASAPEPITSVSIEFIDKDLFRRIHASLDKLEFQIEERERAYRACGVLGKWREE